MAIEKTLIELSEKDLKEIICDHFGLQHSTASISVYKYDGDQREPSYLKVTVTGTKEATRP